MDETATVAATSGSAHRSMVGCLHARRDSNPRIAALETAALPLSYGRIGDRSPWSGRRRR